MSPKIRHAARRPAGSPRAAGAAFGTEGAAAVRPLPPTPRRRTCRAAAIRSRAACSCSRRTCTRTGPAARCALGDDAPEAHQVLGGFALEVAGTPSASSRGFEHGEQGLVPGLEHGDEIQHSASSCAGTDARPPAGRRSRGRRSRRWRTANHTSAEHIGVLLGSAPAGVPAARIRVAWLSAEDGTPPRSRTGNDVPRRGLRNETRLPHGPTRRPAASGSALRVDQLAARPASSPAGRTCSSIAPRQSMPRGGGRR